MMPLTLMNLPRCECHDCTQARVDKGPQPLTVSDKERIRAVNEAIEAARQEGIKAGCKRTAELYALEVLAERKRCAKIVEHAMVYGESTDWAITQIKRGTRC